MRRKRITGWALVIVPALLYTVFASLIWPDSAMLLPKVIGGVAVGAALSHFTIALDMPGMESRYDQDLG